jgi:inner membrane protein
MATIGHVAVGMAFTRWRNPTGKGWRSFGLPALGWSALSLSPDSDILSFHIDIDAEGWDHRGLTHSLFFCLLVASLLAAIAWIRRRDAWEQFRLAFLLLLTHPILDMMTIHGLGCMFFWPLSIKRYLLPIEFIPPSRFGAAFLSLAGIQTMSIEIFLFLPLWLYALWPRKSVAPEVTRTSDAKM